jgi:hypothetical protein
VSIVVSLSTVLNYCVFFILLYGCTVVQDQCTIVALYYCGITSLPVCLNTVHGHCTTVVLDTSNSVYCIATLMECTVQCITLASLIGQYAFFIWCKASYTYTLIYNTMLNADCTISLGMRNPIRSSEGVFWYLFYLCILVYFDF